MLLEGSYETNIHYWFDGGYAGVVGLRQKDAQVSGGHGAHEEKHNEGHNEGHNGEQASEEPSKTTAKWTWSSETPQSNEELTISTQIRTLDGKAVEQFDINHEKKLHLIIVSKDLSYFDHLHPEYNGKGEFEVKTTFLQEENTSSSRIIFRPAIRQRLNRSGLKYRALPRRRLRSGRRKLIPSS